MEHAQKPEEAGEEEDNQDIRPARDGPLEPEAVACDAIDRNREEHSKGDCDSAEEECLPAGRSQGLCDASVDFFSKGRYELMLGEELQPPAP